MSPTRSRTRASTLRSTPPASTPSRRPPDAGRYADRARRRSAGQPRDRAGHLPTPQPAVTDRAGKHPHRPDPIRPHRGARTGRAPPRGVTADPGGTAMMTTSRTRNMSNGSARRVMGVVAAAMIVALAIWALARLLDVELTVGNGHVSAADVVVTALLAGLAALGVRAQLPSAGPIDPGHLSAAALAISIIGPTWLADGLARVVLIGMHVAVGL